MKPVRMGIVGCGNISGIYIRNLCAGTPHVTLAACADLEAARAEKAAGDCPGLRVSTLDDMLADSEIELILNLTTPPGHYPVALRAVEAGKHVYNEKPLALTRAEGRALLDAAARAGVRVGCAPDTFLGAGIQTCRRLIDAGAIGEPVGAQAFMLCRGPEGWHPDPEFYYRSGGGPLFDMGPYYLTALVSLLGPIRRVTGSARISFPERTITSEKKRGQTMVVEVPTHIAAVMDFASGGIGTLVTSFDVCGSRVPSIEIFGADATLSVPNPNGFGGPVQIRRNGGKEWEEIPVSGGPETNARGIGPADLAEALRTGRPHRASGEMAFHVLDVMHAILESAAEGRHQRMQSTCRQPDYR